MATKSRRKFLCVGCSVDTGRINEFYFIKTEIWLSVMPSTKGMLCIGCLEGRLGRRLQKDDFTNAFINSVQFSNKSERLLSRLRGI